MTSKDPREAADFIRSRFDRPISTAVVLGSGLGAFADEIEDAVRIPYEEIPGFARSTVEGHAGQLVLGSHDGVNGSVQQGHFPFYEGYEMEQVIFPTRTFASLGAKNLILTNAAGSLNTDMKPGSLMVITDHLNCMGVNPLRGKNDDSFGPRFPDMTEVYDREFQQFVEEEAAAITTKGADFYLGRGVYCGLSGPTYETPAEIRMYRLLGADAVGMSTVPEAIAARHAGLRVLGISCITNLGAGLSGEIIHHAEVMETGDRVKGVFRELLRRVIGRIGS